VHNVCLMNACRRSLTNVFNIKHDYYCKHSSSWLDERTTSARRARALGQLTRQASASSQLNRLNRVYLAARLYKHANMAPGFSGFVTGGNYHAPQLLGCQKIVQNVFSRRKRKPEMQVLRLKRPFQKHLKARWGKNLNFVHP